jgi:hypothetical protein
VGDQELRLSGGHFIPGLFKAVQRVRYVAGKRAQFAWRPFFFLRYCQYSKGRQDLGSMCMTCAVYRHRVISPARKTTVSQNLYLRP